ncbi:MAG TPA: hypothetical protein VKX46_15145 [Ktedonobacteraceae bacterium]|nr:hypothetical protein [Ktedonobacteraceae bacterium]
MEHRPDAFHKQPGRICQPPFSVAMMGVAPLLRAGAGRLNDLVRSAPGAA